MKARKEHSRKVIPISPWFHPPPEQEVEGEKELPADLATVQRWLNYADIALRLPPARDSEDDKKAA